MMKSNIPGIPHLPGPDWRHEKMDNLLLSFNVISPIFLMMVLGYGIKRSGLMGSRTLDQMNDICFKVFFPLLLFNSIYKTDVEGAFLPGLLLFGVGSVLLIFLLLLVVVPLIEKDNRRRGVLVQGIFRSNFVIFGLPISIALCGGENIGPTSILIAVIVPLYNALSILALEIFRGEKIRVKKILFGVITNPFVIAGVLGIAAFLLEIRFPTAIDSTISSLSNIATPLALILLGASFRFGDVRPNLRPILIGVLGKLILVPLIFIPIYVLAGFRGVELVALVVMIGAPTAVSTFTMAGKMDADQTLAGQLVVFDSLGSILTMFLWIFLLKQMGLF